MKILAVIPARAGSKGIPNKNIRLLNNHPLIFYSINNALKSKFITDIIVSTDSPEVEIIAAQMGVEVRLRRPELCGDSVTLDSVVYDAAMGSKSDYIITIQPTSPTINCETIDLAIQYCIEYKLDTLISVYNQPHLSWKNLNGIKVPNYKERLNRQYLPENYIETGAFLITRYEALSPKSRIGKKIDIFEVSAQEAIDIDTFDDLQRAENILQGKTVAFYVNGNNSRGMGHVYRALEIADEFYCRPDIYYDQNQTDRNIFGSTTHNLIPVNGISELFNLLKKKKYDFFINDILTTTIDYMIALKTVMPNAKIINFEDDGEGVYKADLVINALYQKSEMPSMKYGEKYYIASKLFMFYQPIKINEKINNVFISFGGADPQNYTDRILEIVSKGKYSKYKFYLVLGRAKLNIDKLLGYNKCHNIKVLYDIRNMPEIMSKCDIGITSRGRTGYELAILGIPSIAMAQNAREEKHGFVNNEHGFFYLGLNPSNNVIENTLDAFLAMTYMDRKIIQENLLSHDLRQGRRRVMNLINSL